MSIPKSPLVPLYKRGRRGGFFIFLSFLPAQLFSQSQIEHTTVAAQGQVLKVKIVSDFREQDEIELMFLEKVTPCYLEPAPPPSPLEPARSPSRGRSWLVPPSSLGHSPLKGEGEETWQCLAGIPADAPTGQKRISLFKNGIVFDSKEVELIPTSYPTEPLHLSEETKSLFTKKGRDKERKKVGRAMAQATLTKEKFWNEKPQKPLVGKMESPYGERRILDGKLRAGFHRGVDIGATEGTPIAAMQDGKVLLAEEFSQEGKMVLLNHGQGLVSAYLHLSEILVKPNKRVKKGEVLGKVGSTGVSNSPHLHWGTYIHGVPVDPEFFVTQME